MKIDGDENILFIQIFDILLNGFTPISHRDLGFSGTDVRFSLCDPAVFTDQIAKGHRETASVVRSDPIEEILLGFSDPIDQRATAV